MRVPAAIRVFARERQPFPEDTKDISQGGFSVATAEPLEVGTACDFELRLPHHDPALVIHGEVVWRGVGTMGVKLIRAEPRYEAYVDRLLKDSDRL